MKHPTVPFGEPATDSDWLRKDRDRLLAANAELAKALATYADPEYWQEMTGEFLVHELDDDDRIVWDAGAIARAAIAKAKQPTTTPEG